MNNNNEMNIYTYQITYISKFHFMVYINLMGQNNMQEDILWVEHFHGAEYMSPIKFEIYLISW